MYRIEDLLTINCAARHFENFLNRSNAIGFYADSKRKQQIDFVKG